MGKSKIIKAISVPILAKKVVVERLFEMIRIAEILKKPIMEIKGQMSGKEVLSYSIFDGDIQYEYAEKEKEKKSEEKKDEKTDTNTGRI